MPKLELNAVAKIEGSDYPAPFAEPMAGRIRQALGAAGGLVDFGVNLTQLPPGAWSSQRHWHPEEDEFIYVLSGELTLITAAGEQLRRAGDCAAFPKNVANGHHMINRGSVVATCLDIGSRSARGLCTYSDIDMQADGDDYLHKDGSRYPR